MTSGARQSLDLVVIGGPNGAGKTTVAPQVLPGLLGIRPFVNADSIAQGLSPFDPAASEVAAGRLMLRRVEELLQGQVSFGLEITLASRSFLAPLERARQQGYRVHLVFVWVADVELALSRIRGRVRRGGHDVPEAVARRRYGRSLDNFFHLYRPLSTTWALVDNSGPEPRLVARWQAGREVQVELPETWQLALQEVAS